MEKDRLFESHVDIIKYKVLRELARQTWAGRDAFMAFNDIANVVVKKGEPPSRCCIYKDRAIIAERIRIGLGEYHGSKDTVQVVSIACDECPKSGHVVTSLCRGCLAHYCRSVCPKGAIAIDTKGYAHIDKERCIECGRCASACKYHAITNMIRPCERSCPVDAISMSEDGSASIDQDQCIVCGTCITECPFGALNDISAVVRVIHAIQAKGKENRRIYAIVAPAVASQYPGLTTAKVFGAIKAIGFDEVVEVAAGADETALTEAEELLERGFLTSSCCPAFVEYVRNEFPMLADKVSDTPSPMVMTGRAIKAKDPEAIVVFIGPCIAKKYERKTEKAEPYIDHVLTFMELQALFDSTDIDIEDVEEMELQDASCYGRGFAQSGGVTAAIVEALKELGHADFAFKPVIANGVEECRAALLKAKASRLDGNFIEGMICAGGCVRGNGTMVNKKNTPMHMQQYCEASTRKSLQNTK